MVKTGIAVESNVWITGRDRGKLVPSLCRRGHNIFVDLGREYLSERISPADTGYVNPEDTSLVRYIGLGVGGNLQDVNVATVAPAVNTDYPGQQTFDKNDATLTTLERPVKVTGTAGQGTSAGVWMNSVAAPPTHPTATQVEFVATFSTSDLHLGGAYPSVPLAEVGLMLSNQSDSLVSNQVYNYSASPAHIASTRQTLIAYHPFSTISKTNTVALEIHWTLSF